MNFAVTCRVFGGRVLLWAVARFEKAAAETRWVAMKERKILLPDSIPMSHTEMFSVGMYGKHPHLRPCLMSGCSVPH
jgi:hypothetical protein